MCYNNKYIQVIKYGILRRRGLELSVSATRAHKTELNAAVVLNGAGVDRIVPAVHIVVVQQAKCAAPAAMHHVHDCTIRSL